MIQIHNSALTVTVNPFGAELQSIIDASGRELLWQGDPAYWSGRAPILFPVAGSFLHNEYRYEGVTYHMTSHGFASERLYTVVQQSENAVSLMLCGKEENYPFDYCLTVHFELPGDQPSLRVTYTVENKGTGDMYFGAGSHEAYACPEGVEAYHLEFPEDTSLTNYLLKGPQLNHLTEEIALDNGHLALTTEMLAKAGTLVFPELKSRSVTLRKNDGSRFVKVDFDGMDNLLFWQVKGAGYLCIEPWTHSPEYTDHDGELVNKPGIRKLAPGEKQDITHTITFG